MPACRWIADKQRLLGISKRGDPYLRMLLIHGARSVVYRCVTKTDSRSRWIADKQRRLETTKACVAPQEPAAPVKRSSRSNNASPSLRCEPVLVGQKVQVEYGAT